MRPRALILVLLLAALPVCGQDATPEEIERMVACLGHEDYAVRSEATARLEALGPAAREALEGALGSSDPEVRLRAKELLEALARRVPFEDLVAEQRERKLGRVTLALEAVSFDAFAKEVATQTGLRLKAPESAPGELTVRAEAKPLSEVLGDLGWAVDRSKVRSERFAENRSIVGLARIDREGLALVPIVEDPTRDWIRIDVAGGEFRVKRLPWSQDGARKGWIFEIDACPDFPGDLEWRVDSIVDAAGDSQPIETCPRHSPDRIYVPRPDLDRPAVRLAGVARWRADVPVRMDDPAGGRTKEIGGWLVAVAWPSLQIEPPRPSPQFLIESVLTAEDIRWTARPGAGVARDGSASATRIGIGVGGGVGGPGGPPGWCGCPGGPIGAAAPRALGSSNTVTAGGRASAYSIEQIASIEFTFHLPVEERFETTSAPVQEEKR